MEKKTLAGMNENERVKAVASALAKLNLTNEEQDIPLCEGLVLHMHVASNCDLEEEDWNEFQRDNGGAAGVYFCVEDEDGEDVDLGGGQYDSLSNESAEIPDGMLFRLADSILGEIRMDVVENRAELASAK